MIIRNRDPRTMLAARATLSTRMPGSGCASLGDRAGARSMTPTTTAHVREGAPGAARASGRFASNVRFLAGVWVLAFSFYGLTGIGHSSSWDSILTVLSARNFFYRGDLAVPAYPGTKGMHKQGVDGRHYIKFAPGLVFAHLPMLAVSRVAKHFPLLRLPSGERPKGRYEDEFWVQLTNAWITASLLVLLALFVMDLGGSRRDAWMIVLVVGIASPVWIYARADSTEALQGLALLGAAYFLHRGRVGRGVWRHSVAGAFAGLAILSKTFNAVLIPLFLVYLLTTTRSRRVTALGAFLAPIAVAAALSGLYNYARFGSPFDTGYDFAVERFDKPLAAGMSKLLFSPSYGLVVFWPASLLILIGARRQWRAHPAETTLAAGVFIAVLFLYASWWAFQGFGWAPRFLIPAIPLLALLMIPVVTSTRRAARIATIACLLAGVSVQTLACTTNHWQQVLYGVFGEVDCGRDASRCHDDPRIAPLRIALWRVHAAYLRVHHPERFAAHVEAPPWRNSHPWRAPEKLAERQWENTGVDFWAAPTRWRLEWYYLWAPGMKVQIPSSPMLAGLLAVLAGSALLIVRRSLDERG